MHTGSAIPARGGNPCDISLHPCPAEAGGGLHHAPRLTKAVPAKGCSTRPGPMSDQPLGRNPDMFSIPAAGLAKSLIAVTISLHPAAAHHAAQDYTVHAGDTLSAIAAHEYGRAADWPAVWWANRHQVKNPSMIATGQRLTLPASGTVA